MDQQKRSYNVRRYVVINIIAFVSLVIVFILLVPFLPLLQRPSHPLSPSTSEGHCGLSPADARSHGCLFDPTSFSWLAASCFDEDLTRQFLDAEDWNWYLDIELQHKANRTAVLAGEYELLFVDLAYHLQHCTYMWRKLHRAVLSGSVVDGYVGSYNHTMHCGALLLGYETVKGPSSESTQVLITTKYPACSRKKDGMKAGWYRAVNGSKYHDLSEIEKYINYFDIEHWL